MKKKISISEILQNLMSEEDKSDIESGDESVNEDNTVESNDEFSSDDNLKASNTDTETEDTNYLYENEFFMAKNRYKWMKVGENQNILTDISRKYLQKNPRN